MANQEPQQLEFASDEWFAEVLRTADWIEPTPGVDVRQQVVLTDSPVGTLTYCEEIRDGKMQRISQGTHPEPDVVMTMRYDDFRRLLEEDIASDQLPNRPRLEGDLSKVEQLIPIRHTEGFRRHRAHLRRVTRWL